MRLWAICAFILGLVHPGSGYTQPDAEPRAGLATAPTTWAVRVEAESRCAADADFGPALSDPIPWVQRASVDEAELVASVMVTRQENAQHATVHVFDRVLNRQAGARELTLPLAPCRETAEALSLVISVLVEAGRAALVPEPLPQPPEPPAAPPPASPEPQPSEEEEADSAARKRSAWEGKRYSWLGPKAGHDLTAQVGVGYGLLPGAYLGGTVGWAIRPTRTWPIWLSATGFLPHEAESGRGEFSAVYGGVSVCPLTGTRGRLRGQLCPGFAVGMLWAEGKRLRSQNARSLPIALVGLETKGDFTIAGPLAFSLTARLEVPLLRPEFAYDRLDNTTAQIFRTAPVTLTGFGGLSLIFR